MSKQKIPSVLETNGIFGSPTAGLWNWISAGLNIITPDLAYKEIKENDNKYNLTKEKFEKFLKKNQIVLQRE